MSPLLLYAKPEGPNQQRFNSMCHLLNLLLALDVPRPHTWTTLARNMRPADF